jgi:hypothetical protein
MKIKAKVFIIIYHNLASSILFCSSSLLEIKSSIVRTTNNNNNSDNLFPKLQNFNYFPCDAYLFLTVAAAGNDDVSDVIYRHLFASNKESLIRIASSLIISSSNFLNETLIHWEEKLGRNNPSSKCSFLILNSTIFAQNWTKQLKLRSSEWFHSCSQTRQCYHFTLLLEKTFELHNNKSLELLLANISGSVNTEMEAFTRTKSPINHYILLLGLGTNNDDDIYQVCSSKNKSYGKILINETIPLPTTKMGCKRSQETSIRIVKYSYNSPNLNDMHSWYKSKNRKILFESSTPELFFHFQLALYLNISLEVQNVMFLGEMLRKLHDDEVDLSLGFPFSHRHAMITGFTSQPIAMDKFIFFIGLPRPIPSRMSFLLQPFHYSLWLSIFASICILSGFTLLALRYLFGGRSSLNWLLLPLVDQSQNLNSNVFGIKVILSFWFCAAIVLNTTYKCRLVSLLVTPEMELPPRTFAELLSSPIKYNLFHPGYPNSTGLEMDLRSSDTPITRLLVDRIKGIHGLFSVILLVEFFSSSSDLYYINVHLFVFSWQTVECLVKVNKDPEAVCIGPLDYYSGGYKAMTGDKSEPYVKSEDSILPILSHIALQKNSPFQG